MLPNFNFTSPVLRRGAPRRVLPKDQLVGRRRGAVAGDPAGAAGAGRPPRALPVGGGAGLAAAAGQGRGVVCGY